MTIIKESLIKDSAQTIAWKIPLLLACLLILQACGFKEARLKREKNASAHYQYGIAYLADKPQEILRAHIEFQKASELDKNNREAFYALGHVNFLLMKHEDAITAFKQVLSIDPNYSQAHNYLGKIYASQGKYDLAIASYESALRNSKYETPEAPYWNLALVFIRQKKYKYAIQALNNALLMKPGITLVHNLLGKTYFKMGEYQKSIEAYEKTIQITPDNVAAHYGLACAYRQQGDQTLSEMTFDTVLSLSPALQDQENFKACLFPDD